MAKEHFNTLNSSDVNVDQEFDVSRLKVSLVLFRYVGRFITPGCRLVRKIEKASSANRIELRSLLLEGSCIHT
jgi:hypothetical protein